ncbi:E3 ubiquitin-protein ligase Os04g0590900-like [Zingiber officinale]|uniref:RING-type E3 ubiquitin transferase n=1 Tax=Zingiber officinale TaxID=94328 RepID=A0A8J5GGT8_ZINOF|nr:E3 ubiquitin-protein ligase Os04g0590900-like [Zingiber officinale]KAG6507287.1 hypothetical protein ZIOFF_032629 [Zingiber officinale]
MASQSWVPYLPTRDCFMGFCSVYCPQWCYVLLPPPPPPLASSSANASAIFFAAIGILAGALLLLCYRAFASHHCLWLDRYYQTRFPGDNAGGQSTWPNGLDEALIRKIAVHEYRLGDGAVHGTVCAVCLSEFLEAERLRLLPKCGHAFHLPCIDAWLSSRSNCPLCRSNIAPPLHLPPAPEALETERGREEEASRAEEVTVNIENEINVDCEETTPAPEEAVDAIVEARDGDEVRSFLVNADRIHIGIHIGDVLKMKMEDEIAQAKKGVWIGSGGGSSGRRPAGQHRKNKGLHGVMRPVAMKRSCTNGKLWSNTKHVGKGRNGSPLQEEETSSE